MVKSKKKGWAMKSSAKGAGGAMTVAGYEKAQKPELAAICRVLRKEIDATLPMSGVMIYHAMPVWFIAGNPVVGFSVNAKKKVNLLFWNGQAFGEPDLEAVGKFHAAQIQFGDVEEIDKKKLKKWLKRAGKDIWDFEAYRKKQT
jgi:uncharacterized protein YdhG (YjbR/CyaY superfamily)